LAAVAILAVTATLLKGGKKNLRLLFLGLKKEKKKIFYFLVLPQRLCAAASALHQGPPANLTDEVWLGHQVVKRVHE
jgi:hypothetical protein